MKFVSRCLSILILLNLICSNVTVYASETTDTVAWPTGPSITAETAILIEVTTGTVLYDKNMHQQMYPASITKTLTTYIATQKLTDLSELVFFDYDTIQTIPYDSSRIWVDDGEALSVDDCIAAIMIASANDVAAGLAVHISGSLEAFADLMNETATELGCLNSNFVNPHGYYDDNHYTTAYDMAQIGRAFFTNELLASYSDDRVLYIEPSEYQPDEIWENSKNELFDTRTYDYDYLVGSKTGYTSEAGQTLISCAMKDGMMLIAVVLNAESPNQYIDTVSLFEFGFENFKIEDIQDSDLSYIPSVNNLDVDVADVFGDSSALFEMDDNSYVVIPKDASFSDVDSQMEYSPEDNTVATIQYTYLEHDVGTSQILINSTITEDSEDTGVLDPVPDIVQTVEEENSILSINVHLLITILATLIILILSFKLITFCYVKFLNHRNPHRSKKRHGLYYSLFHKKKSRKYPNSSRVQQSPVQRPTLHKLTPTEPMISISQGDNIDDILRKMKYADKNSPSQK
ncbi:MAG: D-alanyl-D-alanine carboxypeptidase family protein [Lachnospiraceae bacterium]